MTEMNGDILSLLKQCCSLQEERAHTYHLFQEAHKIYLKTAPQYDFVRFRQLVHEITQEFKRISEGIISIEQRLKTEFKSSYLADIISQLQEEEKTKLELTVKLQLAKQSVIDHPEEPERQAVVIDLKHRLGDVVEKINEYLEELRYKMQEL
ncbi:required for excision 1-B domain-containing protein-like [Tachypleus tridentatus]|uniref:required for excision 1-B domain-containing protein-like n=1 Tax=Tachypleus tridentatus TaxID=6853 RepID=UPI003FD07C8C